MKKDQFWIFYISTAVLVLCCFLLFTPLGSLLGWFSLILFFIIPLFLLASFIHGIRCINEITHSGMTGNLHEGKYLWFASLHLIVLFLLLRFLDLSIAFLVCLAYGIYFIYKIKRKGLTEGERSSAVYLGLAVFHIILFILMCICFGIPLSLLLCLIFMIYCVYKVEHSAMYQKITTTCIMLFTLAEGFCVLVIACSLIFGNNGFSFLPN